MYELHDAVVVPLLDAVGATTLLEIGADQADHTGLLRDWCAQHPGRHVHVIETVPSGPLLELVGDAVVLHVGTSHDRIGDLPPIDVALIDGDHNHWTVLTEVRLLVERHAALGVAPPVMIFHDVGFPYGRRDMYYAPERIPEAHRQPYAADRAIRLGSDELTEPPGLNLGFANALRAGGPANGVLTAVEDAAAEIDGSRLEVLPALHGLAVLVPAAHRATVDPFLDRIAEPGPQRAALEVIEHRRLAALQQVQDEAWVKAHAQADLEEARAALADTATTIGRLEATIADVEAARDVARDEAEEARRLADEHRAEADRVRAELEAVQASRSYRGARAVSGALDRLRGTGRHRPR